LEGILRLTRNQGFYIQFLTVHIRQTGACIHWAQSGLNTSERSNTGIGASALPFTTPSDGRFKFNVQEDVKGLDFILQLRPVTYQFNVEQYDAQWKNIESKSGISRISITENDARIDYSEALHLRRTGFIAQEVEQAAKTSKFNFSGIIKPKAAGKHYNLSYESFVVPLVKAVQEQQEIIRELQQQGSELRLLIKKAN
jgi:trimeric autotransporter adhesin